VQTGVKILRFSSVERQGALFLAEVGRQQSLPCSTCWLT
jgi:hypothetical protein